MGKHKKAAKRLRKRRRKLLEWVNSRLEEERKSRDSHPKTSLEYRQLNYFCCALVLVIERMEDKS